MIRNIQASFPEEIEENFKYLYHYTNLEAVKSILKSKKLRMTDSNSQNDETEGKLILDHCSNKQICKLLLSNFYLCSFSRLGNLLSQWRGYGDINIGFDYTGIAYGSRYITDKKTTNLDTSGTQFLTCYYLTDEDVDFKKLVQSCNEIVDEIDDSNIQYNLLKIGLLFFGMKHLGFSEENECRLISYLWKRVPFKNGDKNYIEYNFDPNVVKRIIVGPSKDQEKNIQQIQEIIAKNKEYKNVEIWRSKIPFIRRRNLTSR